MSRIKLKGIIFDLDGTLGNTLPVCFAAFQAAFQKYAPRQYTNEEIATYFGPSEEGVIEKIVGSQWEPAFKVYLETYEKAHTICDQPFPGIEAALNLCQENNIALAVVTGKGELSADISLRYLNLIDYFDIVVTGSNEGGIKPFAIKTVLERWRVASECVAYVGDSPSDMTDAKEAGVIPLAAAWAETSSFERLQQMSPAAIFRTVESLIDWIWMHSQ
jgi:phosphoglycolate phosphatase-like HAD superfamily hydrolase